MKIEDIVLAFCLKEKVTGSELLKILLFIKDQGFPIKRITGPQVYQSLSTLEKKGYVKQEANTNDLRKKYYTLTKEGHLAALNIFLDPELKKPLMPSFDTMISEEHRQLAEFVTIVTGSTQHISYTLEAFNQFINMRLEILASPEFQKIHENDSKRWRKYYEAYYNLENALFQFRGVILEEFLDFENHNEEED